MPTASLPVGVPSVDPQNNITISAYLANPTRITQRVYELTFGELLLTRFFAGGGSVTGGAMVVNQVAGDNMFLDRDVQMVPPAGEFPVVSGQEVIPIIAPVEKWGGKMWIADEARDRNDAILWRNELVRLSNTILRTLNLRAMEIVQQIFVDHTAYTRAVTVGGVAWDAIASTPGLTPTQPANDVLTAIFDIGDTYGGATPDTVLLNKQEAIVLHALYGEGWRSIFTDPEGRPMTVRIAREVAAGKAYVFAEGEVGEVRYERGLFTETWREPGTERTWSQTSVKPAMATVNPGAIRELTGLHT